MRKKGSAKTGGRSKGSVNKITRPLKELLSNYSQESYDRFVAEMDQLQGIEFVKSYLALLEFITPKLQRVSMPIDPIEQPQQIIVSFRDPDSTEPTKHKPSKDEKTNVSNSNIRFESKPKPRTNNINLKDLIL